MADVDQVRLEAERALGPTSRWRISVEREDSGFVVHAQHPASSGLVLETGTFDGDAAGEAVAEWIRQPEVAIAEAAPELEHADIAMGVRTLTVAFEWPTVQVRAVAFLLFEAGALSADEAGWLAGFCAYDAPMRSTPPM